MLFDIAADTVANPARCDKPTPLTGFDPSRYMGIWYDEQHTKDIWYLNDTDVCGQVEYYDLDDTKREFTVKNTSQSAEFGGRAGIPGRCKCPEEDGHCFVDFGSGYTNESNYIIVDTDYENYSIIYSCYSVFKTKIWILSRTPVMPDEYYYKVVDIIKRELPRYDFENDVIPVEYQGDKCTYEALPGWEASFLQ